MSRTDVYFRAETPLNSNLGLTAIADALFKSPWFVLQLPVNSQVQPSIEYCPKTSQSQQRLKKTNSEKTLKHRTQKHFQYKEEN